MPSSCLSVAKPTRHYFEYILKIVMVKIRKGLPAVTPVVFKQWSLISVTFVDKYFKYDSLSWNKFFISDSRSLDQSFSIQDMIFTHSAGAALIFWVAITANNKTVNSTKDIIDPYPTTILTKSTIDLSPFNFIIFSKLEIFDFPINFLLMSLNRY